MNFDHEELMLMMLYNPGTRLGLIQELRLMQYYLAPDEVALRELSERVMPYTRRGLTMLFTWRFKGCSGSE